MAGELLALALAGHVLSGSLVALILCLLVESVDRIVDRFTKISDFLFSIHFASISMSREFQNAGFQKTRLSLDVGSGGIRDLINPAFPTPLPDPHKSY